MRMNNHRDPSPLGTAQCLSDNKETRSALGSVVGCLLNCGCNNSFHGTHRPPCNVTLSPLPLDVEAGFLALERRHACDLLGPTECRTCESALCHYKK